MKMIPLVFSILISINFAHAQNTDQKAPDIDVIRVYERVVEEGYSSPQIYEKLATAYYARKDFANAVIWYEKLIKLDAGPSDPNVYLQFARALEALEKTEKAKKYLAIYQDLKDS